MRALTWHGKHDVRVETVPDPEIVNPRDAIIRITSTAICGSDLHLYDHYIPRMKSGDVLGHEFMGEVVDVGPGNRSAQRRPARRRAVRHRLRQLLLLSEAAVRRLRQLESRREGRHFRDRLRLSDDRRFRLLASDRRLRRRAGRIRARAVRRRRADRDPGRHRRRARCCSCPTSCPRAGWPPRTARSKPATPSPCGDADRSACLRFRVRSCKARSASSRSITIRIGWSLPSRSARKSSTSKRSRCARRWWR